MDTLLGLQPWGMTRFRLKKRAKDILQRALGSPRSPAFYGAGGKTAAPTQMSKSKTNCSSSFCETRKAEVEWGNFWVNIRATETLKWFKSDILYERQLHEFDRRAWSLEITSQSLDNHQSGLQWTTNG